MNRPSGSTSSGDVARGAGFAAAKGILLIGLAVVIGIVLLQQVDDDNGANVGAAPTSTRPPKATTTTAPAAPTTTTTPPPTTPAKTADQVRLIVLNAGAPSGNAGRLSDRLKNAGYTNQPQDANNWAGRTQQGNSVLCKSGLDREGLALVSVVGEGTKIEPYPANPPSVIENASEVNCIVAVGS
jgi:hypothetical protein